MYILCKPGESYHGRLKLVCLCDVFRELISSLFVVAVVVVDKDIYIYHPQSEFKGCPHFDRSIYGI